MAKFKMPASGIEIAGGNGAVVSEAVNEAVSDSGPALTIHDPDGQAGGGDTEATESTAEQAVAMLESDDVTADGESDDGNRCPDCGCAEFTAGDNETITFNCGAVWDGITGVYLSPCGAPEPVAVDDPTLPAPGEAEGEPLDPVLAEVSNRLDQHFNSAAAEAIADNPPSPATEVSVADRLRYARAQAIREWQESCEEAKEKFVAAALAHAKLKAATKIAKSKEEDTMEAYAKLMRQNPAENLAMVQPQAAVAIPAALVRSYDGPADEGASEGEANDPALPAQSEATTPNTDEAWRAVPLSVLDLAPKLAERLIENGVDTIGKLEDLRAKCYDSYGEWPKGIGKAKVTVIEDALLDWLGKNRDRQVFEELGSGAAAIATAEVAAEGGQIPKYEFEDIASAIEAIERNGGKVDTGFISLADNSDPESAQAAVYLCNEWDCSMVAPDGATSITPTPTDAEFAAAITARALEINDGTPDALDEQLNAGYWERGWNAHAAGEPLTSCDLPKSPAQDDFIRGYLAASKAADYERRDEETKPMPAINPVVKAIPTSKPVAAGQMVSMDDL